MGTKSFSEDKALLPALNRMNSPSRRRMYVGFVCNEKSQGIGQD